MIYNFDSLSEDLILSIFQILTYPYCNYFHQVNKTVYNITGKFLFHSFLTDNQSNNTHPEYQLHDFINSVKEGSTIFLERCVYSLTLPLIIKPIRLIGVQEGFRKTVIKLINSIKIINTCICFENIFFTPYHTNDYDNNSYGFIYGFKNSRIMINNCYFGHINLPAIYVESSYLSVTKSYFTSYQGIYILHCKKPIIQDNLFTDCSHPLYINNCENILIHSNFFKRSSFDPIYMLYSTGNIILNSINFSKKNGIRLVKNSNTFIIKNSITNSSGNGICITDSDNITLEYNTFENNKGNGIQIENIYDDGHFLIQCNSIQKNLLNGLIATGSNLLVQKNIIEDNNNTGITIIGCKGSIKNNTTNNNNLYNINNKNSFVSIKN
tara:strand:+ start:26 stop:1168 length:1143 start_codon:yes stop_codon:yes gene_type:complete